LVSDFSNPLEDFGGDFEEVGREDFGTVSGYDTGGFSEILDVIDEAEDALGDRILDDLDLAEGGDYVTQFYDPQSAADYLSDTPEDVLQVYIEWIDDGTMIYHVYRFPSGGA
jgi:hypothetical protein